MEKLVNVVYGWPLTRITCFLVCSLVIGSENQTLHMCTVPSEELAAHPSMDFQTVDRDNHTRQTYMIAITEYLS